MEAVGQFESIVNDSGLAKAGTPRHGRDYETESEPGIIERYLTLSADRTTMLQDMQLNPDGMRIPVTSGSACIPLSDLDDLPGRSGRTGGMNASRPTARTAA